MNSEKEKKFVYRLREAAKLVDSIENLANETNIPIRTMSNYVTGKTEPKLSGIQGIAKVTGVSLEWLINGEGPMMRDNLLAGTDNSGAAQSGLAHSAMAVYLTLYESKKLIKPEVFEELTIAMWELDQQDPDDEDVENPLLLKVQKILTAALKS